MSTQKKISIFIPVYRESDLLEPLLRSLLDDSYGEKEIFIVIDEPTPRSLEVASKFSKNDNIHFTFNGDRKGKANVLNQIVDSSKGEIFLFLDADTIIDGGGESFLKIISEEMKNADIVEVKKDIIRDSFIAKVVSYDYLSFNLTNLYFSRKIGRCLGVNGAAFAIKREKFKDLGGFRRVICEDLDIATRSFTNNMRFKFLDNIAVYTKAPSSWRRWFNQRKRWGIGAAFWFKEYFGLLKNIARKYPKVIVPSLFFIFPALPLILVNLLVPDDLYLKIFYISMILLSTGTNIFIPPAALTSTTLPALRNFLALIVGLVTYSTVFYFAARKLRFHFNLLEFTAFYFIAAPLWLLIVIASLVRVYIKPESIKIDWKI
jgi:cellulose synthase/poly-beta-1,6-N-acetylglucosamine synthase-like glycosyltransferase